MTDKAAKSALCGCFHGTRFILPSTRQERNG
ncbi:hypothetical protein BN438_2610 [Erwinia amylovora UPN527]|uniref:Uncharacterized protein n=2 Tax=Erwinia amylovora TaxID=552 RepID=A0A831A304_ERWAM|nr:hypothetical protein predicted by Glimmer/Critica [Erwinia amylovora ATCC BAA-2158]CCO79402.1 hypothetical protein BN432_2623 [Erwinia amylovora Ea356]CCO83205.1 hypothetical protein BN433_2646 [Erwinia amylovora Ea266]CCO94544.1 hypothetical protein BN437_2634 [Erwinia amylovora NBRC 12687 = CFBP 1232]CCO99875.1 hypothetical protein BN438_2610 [Erwinia amylovora UPN527]